MSIYSNIKKRLSVLGTKELTTKESIEMFKNLVQTSKVPIQKHLQSGNLVTFKYNAKDKSIKYDKTPLVLVLRSNSKYMLGLNFHWLTISRRVLLVDYLIKSQSKQIRNNNPFNVSYKKLKQIINSLGAFPVVRLYIRGRISSNGVKIPNHLLMQAAKLKTETFTQGKANSTTLWKRAKLKAQSAKRKYL